MKRRLLILAAVLCLLCCLTLPVYAADSPYVSDRADLLTDEQEQTLAEQADLAAAAYGCGVYLVTVEDFSAYGATPYDGAVSLYVEQTMYGDVPADGILLMLSMQDRDYSLITYGEYAEAVFTDEAMWKMEDRFLQYFAMNDWKNGFAYYVYDAAKTLERFDDTMTEQYGEGYVSFYEPGVPNVVVRANRYPAGVWAAVLLGSCAVALIVCLVMRSGMRTARKATHADGYIPVGGIELRVKQDRFTHTTRKVIHHPKNNGSSGGGSIGGGGGGFRGHSGKF